MFELYVFCFILLNAFVLNNSQLINKEVERTIDLSSQLVKITSSITLENAGKKSENEFLVLLEPNTFKNLSYVSVKDSHKNDQSLKKTNWQGVDAFSVQLKQDLAPGRTHTFKLEYVFTDLLVPYPNSITQKEKQLVRYHGNHYLYSPYATSKQSTSVVVNSRTIESYTKLKPISQSDTTLNYGPYSDVAPATLDSLVVHFESNAPFLTVTQLERHIEVSHWGNIGVQENVDVLHSGARLKGSFSRYDYQRDTSSTHHSIKSYKTILPASAHSIYYRDSNGNISTSQVRHRKDWIELELRPRYPLFGGWRSSYTLGYSVPSYQYLYRMTDTNKYVLRMRVIDNVFDDMHVSRLETEVVLPVGVSDIKFSTPYPVKRLSDSTMYKYLDTKGRTVVRFSKDNLVEQHILDFEISYTWQPILLFHEPLLLSIALYFLFLMVIVYVRLDFSISKSEHVKNQ